MTGEELRKLQQKIWDSGDPWGCWENMSQEQKENWNRFAGLLNNSPSIHEVLKQEYKSHLLLGELAHDAYHKASVSQGDCSYFAPFKKLRTEIRDCWRAAENTIRQDEQNKLKQEIDERYHREGKKIAEIIDKKDQRYEEIVSSLNAELSYAVERLNQLKQLLKLAEKI